MVNGTFLSEFFGAFSLILATELGDETFITAGLLAMKYGPDVIFWGAWSSLILMTLISTLIGLGVPHLMSHQLVAQMSCLLYLFFGVKLGYSAWTLEESGDEEAAPHDAAKLDPDSFYSFYGLVTQPFGLVFASTFLAEWGDRSQISTMSLAAQYHPLAVFLGGCLGHACTTGLAVQGGAYLGARISKTPILLAGSLFFLVLALKTQLSIS